MRTIWFIVALLIFVGCKDESDKIESEVEKFNKEIENIKSENISSLDHLMRKTDDIVEKGRKIKSSIDSIRGEESGGSVKINELERKVEKSIESVESIKNNVIKKVASGVYQNQLNEKLILRSDGVCRYFESEPDSECRWNIEGEARGGGVIIEMSRYAGPVNVHVGDIQAVLEDGELRIGRGLYKKIRNM